MDNNSKVLKALIRGDYKNTVNEYSRLVENYEFFYNKLDESSISVIKNGISKLLFVDISLKRSEDDPQKIFESLNSTGLDLSQGDLIRNYILMDLKSGLQNKIYSEYWYVIEKLTTKIEGNTNEVSDFIRHFLTIKDKRIPTKSKIFETFKKKYDFKENKLKTVLSEIKTYAGYYNRLINPINESNKKIREQLELIKRLEINVSYPFLLEVYNDKENTIISEDIFIEILGFIQSFVWRRIICNIPTNALNKIFMTLYKSIDKENYLESLQRVLIKKKESQAFPNDEDVYSNLKFKNIYKMKPKNKNYFLERLENFNNNEPVNIIGNSNITIEHIFPQTPEKTWETKLGKKQFNDMKKYLHTIQNLTLSGNNGNLGNKSFIEKRDIKEKGYKASRLYLNKFLADINKWDIEELEKRFEILFKRFLEIWKYPNIQVSEEKQEEEIFDIFDDFDPTRKKIDYVIFDDEEINLENFRDLLIKVTSYFFKNSPDLIFSPNIKEKFKITRNRDDLRDGVKIGESYYIEGKLSAKEIINKIKYLLSIGDKELLIKFK